MSFFSNQAQSKDHEFSDNLPIDLLSDEEMNRTCQLANMIGRTSGSLLFFFDGHEPVLGSSTGLAAPGDFLPTLAGMDSSEAGRAALLLPPYEAPDGLKMSGCVWIRDRKDQVLGGIAVFGTQDAVLDEYQINALSLLGQNLVDLLEQKAELQRSRSFEKIFRFSNDLVCIVDFQGNFESINPFFSVVLGWSWDQIAQRSFSSFIYPEDFEATKEVFGNLIQGKNIQNFVHRFLSADGQWKVIQWTATPDVGASRIYAIGRDVTEERKLENQLRDSKRKLREFFENSQGLMCTHDLEGRFLTVNSAGAAMVGYSREEVLEMSLFELVPEDQHSGVRNYLAQIQSDGKAGGHMYMRHKDGSLRTWIFNNVLQKPLEGEEPYVIGNAIDITARAQLERDLRVTKALLEETGTVARVGGWEWDVTKDRVIWTPVTRLIHEVSEDFNPSPDDGVNFYTEGESRDKITQALKCAIEDGVPWNVDVQITTAKGNSVWVRSIGNPVREDGATIRLMGTIQDIELEKEAELEAARAKKLLVDVFEASSEVSVIATDVNGVISVFNKGAEKMLGYVAEEMIGKRSSEIIHLPEEVEAHSQEVSAEFGYPIRGFEAIVARADRYGSEKRHWTYLCKDGDRRLVELVVTPIRDLDHTTIGHVGIAIDITDKRETERELHNERSRLAAFVKHTPAAVAMLDRDLVYLAVSDRWMQEFKLQDSEVIGRSHFELFAGTITDDYYLWKEKVLQGEVIGRQEEKVAVPGVDEPQYLSWEMRPWYLYDGGIGGMMVLTQNVTGMVKRREELQVAKNQAEEASRAKSEFLANMSHEIRTPLNGVIGFTDLVLKTKLDDTQNQYLMIVNQSANTLLSIINDILDFSKIEAGKLELDVEKTDLYELASQATDIITYQIQKKGLELLLNLDDKLPRFIFSDSVRLKQILVNLLGNASKFTDKGEIELKIHSLESHENHTLVRFEVRDTGIGIHPDKQTKIFEAFSQEDSSTTKKYGGTGLGLTISNKLLGLMNSTLQLRSKLGEGSTFYFDVLFESEMGQPIEWAGLDSIKHVLVVDDNQNNRLIVSQMLRLRNIKTTEATNGFEALQLLANRKQFDVVLMDYHMPFMDGIETIRKIRETFTGHLEDMPILLLHSSSDDQRIIQACREFGIRYRMIKPLKIQELYHVLSHLSKKSGVSDSVEDNPSVITKSFNILIAEDNPINMLLAETIIGNCLPNGGLIKAVNGLEAVEYCKKEVPDLIFMDLQMPVMNGFEAAQQIRDISSCATIPIVALTAGNVKGEREKCLAAGMDDFVVKPVVEETLRDVLKKWLVIAEEVEVTEDPGLEKSVHFDQSKLNVYANGNVDFLQKIFLIVRDELNGSFRDLQINRDSKDLASLKEVGHKLYGTAVSSGFDLLAALSKKLENSESWEDRGTPELVDRIFQEIRIVLAMLDDQ
jgi:PAS domain S-box-containing protein